MRSLGAVFAGFLLLVAGARSENSVTVIALQRYTGLFRGIVGKQGSFLVRVGEKAVDLTEVARISFSPVASYPPEPELVLQLADRSEIWCRISGADSEQLSVESQALGKIAVPLEKTRALLFPGSFPTRRKFERFRLAPREPADQDRLYTTEDAVVQGILSKITPGALVMDTENLGTIKFPFSRVQAVILAQIEKAARREGLTLTAVMDDGSVLRGTIHRLEANAVTLSTIIGPIAVPYKHTRELLVRGGRWVFLDELTPAERIERSFVGSVVWHMHTGANCLGDPLLVRGVRYLRGLGVHSYCRLVYTLQDKYLRFEALAALDDAALDERLDTRIGNVVFRVFVDGEKRFDSGPVSWNDAPKEVKVDLTGAQRLELEVSEGRGFHVRDRADWIEPRLLKGPGGIQ